MIISAFSIVCLNLAVSSAAEPANAVSVQCLTRGKKVIPLYTQCGQFWTTNVKLPDLLVINRGAEVVRISDMEVIGMAEGRQVATNRIAADVPDVVRQVDRQFKNKLGNGYLDEVLTNTMATGFGAMDFAHTVLSESDAVGPGESAILLLSRVLYFTYTGMAKVDDLHVKVFVRQNDQTKELACPISFVPYESKGDYLFPMTGDLCVSNLPMDLMLHRIALSQEFAFDVRVALPLDEGNARGTDKPAPTKLSDYPVFHREVMAIGNGVVVEVGDQFPDSLLSEPSAFSEKDYEKILAELEPKIGFINCVTGNHIIIDHLNGEFSLYAHLGEGTIRVKQGDRVAQGDVIGLVGNTGHTTEPHLHFHLMDSKDFLTANGLPVMFKNVPPNTINQFCTSANALSATDYIFLRVNK